MLVAGMFAFMPIEKASSVHTTILSNQAQTDSLTFTTATAGAAVDADFSLENDSTTGVMEVTGLFIYWDDATLDEANDDSEAITLTACTFNDDFDDDADPNTADVVLGGDDDAADIAEQNILGSIDEPDAGEYIVINPGDSFDCDLDLDTDGTGTDGFIFDVVAMARGGTLDVASADNTP